MKTAKSVPKLTVVYGGQFGSEGKGQTLAAIVRDDRDEFTSPFVAVRVGGPNAGHTVRAANASIIKVQSIPVPAFIFPECIPMIGAGGLINREVLRREMALLKRQRRFMEDPDPVLVLIDDLAMVITKHHIEAEMKAKLQQGIGSTCEGVGAALSEKIWRHNVRVAKDYDWPVGVRMVDTARYLSRISFPVYVEGTQGYRLGLHTSGHFPMCTSRECGPEGIMADIGMSLRGARETEIVCVLRTFPIRVGGNSGEMKDEVDWEYMRSHCGVETPERTTVTNRIRRVAMWDMDAVVQIVKETRPTCLAISFIDYLFPDMAGAKSQIDLSFDALSWLTWVQEETGTPIKYVSTGQGQEFTMRFSIE